MKKFVNGSPQFHIFVKWALKNNVDLNAMNAFEPWWECWQNGWKNGWSSAKQGVDEKRGFKKWN